MAQKVVVGAVGLAVVGVVAWRVSQRGPESVAAAPATESSLAASSGNAAPTPAAPSDVCRAMCEHPGQGKCPRDPKGSDCYALCEKARVTREGRCTMQVDALLRCVSQLPAGSIECGQAGTSQPVAGACEEQVAAMQTCVKG